MTGKIEARLAELGITLPDAPAPAANYVPFVQVGDLVHISGQISADENGLITGKLGAELDTAAGAKAASRCALSLLGPSQSCLWRRSGPRCPSGQTGRLRELDRGFHRTAQSRQWRL